MTLAQWNREAARRRMAERRAKASPFTHNPKYAKESEPTAAATAMSLAFEEARLRARELEIRRARMKPHKMTLVKILGGRIAP